MNQNSDYSNHLPNSFGPSQPTFIPIANDPNIDLIIADFFNTSNNISGIVTLPHINDDIDKNIFDDYLNLPFNHYQQSTTVNPICTIPNDLHESQQQTIQSDALEYRKIQIKSHPREKFRPRTEKESKDTSHYIRCEDYSTLKYPTIETPQIWANQSSDNLIQVTLVDIYKQPHPYTIDNKERKPLSKGQPLIFKYEEEAHTLYFRLTDLDYIKGEKTFLIAYMKSKQDDIITKDLIKTRQLNQSMLRFTRFYQIDKDTYQRDEESVEYSCIMTEDYGDFTIEDIFPLCGPMYHNQKVCVELKGNVPKDFKNSCIINITGNGINWFHKIDNMKTNRNNIIFVMPSFPYGQINRAIVNIIIEYKQEIIYQAQYVYTRRIDEELNAVNSIEPLALDYLSINEPTGVLPSLGSSGKGCQNQGVKRLQSTKRKK